MSDSTGDESQLADPDVDTQWDWHEVVHSEQFSEPDDNDDELVVWRRGWGLLQYGVVPLLLTALAMTTAVLTLVGLVAKPFPFSPSPIFGGSPHTGGVTASVRPTGVPQGTKSAGVSGSRPGPTSTAVSAQPTPAVSGSRAVTTPTGSPGSGLPLPNVSLSASIGLPELPLPSLPLPTVSLSLGVPPLLPPRVGVPLPTISIGLGLP